MNHFLQVRNNGRLPTYDVTSHDSAWVFCIKALLFPVTATAFLCLCLSIWNQPISGTHFLILVICFVGVGELLDFAKFEQLRQGQTGLNALTYIVSRWVFLCACIWVVLHLTHLPVRFRDKPLLTWFLLTPAVLWAAQWTLWTLLLNFGVQRMRLNNAIIIGLTEQAQKLDAILAKHPLLRIRSLGFFSEHPGAEQDERQPFSGRVLGSLNDLSTFVRDNSVQIVYITLPMARTPELMKLLDELSDSTASVYFVPDIFSLQLMQARLDVMHGIPLIAICDSPFFGGSALVKRCSDIVLASAILVMISPVLIAVALGVKLSSPGPVLFKQRRYGLDGQEILVYKFRSMSVTEDGQHQYTQVTRNDSRVTPFGAFIRRTSLDELPQFLNVLMGSMSIVGPRPHAIAVNEHYRSLIPSYMIRHKVKPGITGWAQVNGYRGGDDLPTMTKRIEFDLDYLSNWSLWFDLKIIARTVLVVFKDTRAF